MADRKISELSALSAGSQATGDLLTIVDVSEAAAADKNKKITTENFFKGIPGDVGINVSSPASNLHVKGNNIVQYVEATGTAAEICFRNNTSTGDNIRIGGSGNNLTFDTGGSEVARIDSSGNLGVGTTAPNEKLVVSGNASVTGAFQITTNTTAPSASSFLFRPASNQIALGTNSNERLRIDASGRLLVGLTTARSTGSGFTAFHQIEGGGTVSAASASIISNRSTDNLGPRLNFARSKGGSVGSNTVVTNDAELGGIYFWGADGIDLNNLAASIVTEVDGGVTANDVPGAIVFSTTAVSQSTPTERLRIDNAGRVGVGISDPGSYYAGGDNLVVGSTGGDHGVTIRTGSSGQGIIAFADGTSGASQQYAGYVLFDHSVNALWFATGTVERLRIDSSGQVGIGESSPASVLHTKGTRDYTGTTPSSSSYDNNFQSGTAFVSIGQSNGCPAIQGHGSGTAYNLALAPNAGKVGIGTTSPAHALDVRSGNTGVIVARQTTNNGGYNIYEGDDSSGNTKFYVSHNGRVGASEGVIFGSDTAAANVLDDYEEGTFTPSYGNLTNFDHSSQTGRYVKVGKVVTVYIQLATQNAASISDNGSTVTITGLPFGAENSGNSGTSMVVLTHDNRFTNNPNYGQIQSGSNTTIVLFKDKNMNSASGLRASDFDATNSGNFNLLNVNFTYEVD
jgi:hypothetical protein